MILEKNDKLILIKRLCDWLEEKGMSPTYFFDTLEEMGFAFPLRVCDFVENNVNSFSFLCYSADYEHDNVAYRFKLDLLESSPRIITFSNIHGFWEQPMFL
jgi:hypothetical protein